MKYSQDNGMWNNQKSEFGTVYHRQRLSTKCSEIMERGRILCGWFWFLNVQINFRLIGLTDLCYPDILSAWLISVCLSIGSIILISFSALNLWRGSPDSQNLV